MLTREIAITMVKEFINSCRDADINFEKVILFGSVAEEKNITEYSDIDLLLISNQFTDSLYQNHKLIAPVNRKYTLIDAKAYPSENFKKGDPFINEILKTGIVIE